MSENKAFLKLSDRRDRVVGLLSDVGDRFEKTGYAEIYRYATWHPSVYMAQNVHAFFRGYWNPTVGIYVLADIERSAETEVCVSGRLIFETDMIAIGNELETIRRNKTLLPPTAEEIESAFERLKVFDVPNSFDQSMLPYDVASVEQEIIKRIPHDALR